MEEYIARVGQQAAVIYCTPGKSQHQPHYYKVVGSQPLQNVVSVDTCISLTLCKACCILCPLTLSPDSSVLYCVRQLYTVISTHTHTSSSYRCTRDCWFRFSLGYFLCFACFSYLGPVCLFNGYFLCFWCIFSCLF